MQASDGIRRPQLLKKRAEILRVFLLHGEDPLEHPASHWILHAKASDNLAIAVDGDSLGDEVFLDHVEEGISFDILRVAPIQKTLR